MKLAHPIIVHRVGIQSRLMLAWGTRDDLRGTPPMKSRKEQGLTSLRSVSPLPCRGLIDLALLGLRDRLAYLHEALSSKVRPRKKRGPAPLPAVLKRNQRVSVYVTDSELADIQRKAKLRRIKPPEFMRAAALDAWPPIPRPIPPINLEAWEALARVASNLNQLAKAFNTSGDLAVLSEARGLVAELRGRLIGLANDQDGDA